MPAYSNFHRLVSASKLHGAVRRKLGAGLCAFAACALTSSLASAQTFGPRQVISQTGSWSRGDLVVSADLDGDGDADVLSNFPSGINWYESLGGGSFGPEQVLTSSALEVEDVYATDLDGDGDADVLSAEDDTINWYENSGSGSFGPKQTVLTNLVDARIVRAADLDGDGDIDVVSGWVSLEHQISVSENLGGGAFSTQAVDHDLPWGLASFSVVVDDLDADGDVDILAAHSGGTRWCENLGGAFSPGMPLGGAPAARSVVTADVDGDTDADVIMASQRADDWILRFENLSGGFFGPEREIGYWSVQIDAGDLDGDGDVDVLAIARLSGDIVWFENLGSLDCNGNGQPDEEDIATGLALDCNWNSIPDSCDIAAGTAEDCNGNGIPDYCDMFAGTAGFPIGDCDFNSILDECELASDPTRDLNGNGVLDTCEDIGSVYCAPAVANSTGESAEILALGSNRALNNDVTLAVRGLPLNVPMMFFNSQSQGFAFPIPSSQGALCVAGLAGRYSQPGQIVLSGSTGSVMFPIDLATIPTPLGFVQAMAGETWNFQAWFRDFNPGSTSNFTDAVGITFQ